MIYEYRVYTAAPGKMEALHHRFANVTLDLFERHGLKVIGFWVPEGKEDEELAYILAFDSEDRLYLADEQNQRITVFDKMGMYLSKWGVQGAAEGQLNGPSGLAFDAEDNLYVVDSRNHRVQKFNRNGSFIGAWGEMGDGPGQFNMPWGISVGQDGTVYVADWRNDRIQKFTAAGEYLGEIGSSGSGSGQFHRPTGVAVDKDGDIYVADWGNEQVQVLSPEGEVLARLRGDSIESKWANDYFLANPEEGAARRAADLEPVMDPPTERNREESANIEKLFWAPVSVILDDVGRVYVTEGNRHRIQVFERTS